MNNEELRDKRREFLKTSALVAGGVMLNGVAFAGGGAHSSVDDTIKIALIGCGDRGTGAAYQALSTKENLKLVAMADAFQDRLDNSYKVLSDKFGAKVDVPQDRKFVGFEGYKKAIALADVVLLVTPPGFRPSHFEEAIKQGKHVFMEKPVAVDAPGIRKVLATAELAKQKNIRASHKIRFAEDPGLIDERHRIRWNGIDMRVTSPAYNAHGLDRIWTMYAEALSRDTASQESQVSGATVG